MTSDKPGFRRSAVADRATTSADPACAALRGPFSQAQIAHLMKTEFARARRHDYPISCLLIEVDRLQALTELHGSSLKSEVRRQLARIVEEKTRGHDHLGSMNDGSYLLVLSHTDAERAQSVAERIRRTFDEFQLDIDGASLRLSLSIGIAACADRETMFFETLVSQAEVALDWAARDGGDRCVLFEREKFVKPNAG